MGARCADQARPRALGLAHNRPAIAHTDARGGLRQGASAELRCVSDLRLGRSPAAPHARLRWLRRRHGTLRRQPDRPHRTVGRRARGRAGGEQPAAGGRASGREQSQREAGARRDPAPPAPPAALSLTELFLGSVHVGSSGRVVVSRLDGVRRWSWARLSPQGRPTSSVRSYDNFQTRPTTYRDQGLPFDGTLPGHTNGSIGDGLVLSGRMQHLSRGQFR